ncbi:MAG: YbjN domain-containing protein [bacterium]|nr:YbjN domain-containing protein [bacterium]
MQFQHSHHEETHNRVGEILGELFDAPYLDEDNAHFYVGYGSTVLEISVEPYGPEETTVEVTAYCVQGVILGENLLLGLLELNHELPIGAFSLVGKDIFFSQSIFGRSIDRKNLLGTIAAVANVSDEYDDRIVETYGGQTALDRIRDTGGRKKRSAAAS